MIKNNIPKVLEYKKINISELAESLGRGYSGVHRLVNRESLDSTPIGTLAEVADVLGVKVEDLYEIKEKGVVDMESMSEIDRYREEGRKLARLYSRKRQLSPEDRVKMLTPKVNIMRGFLKVENKEDFFHELVLLYSDVGGNMIYVANLLTDKEWANNAYAFLAGLNG